jgi:hypothetical protein
MFPLLGNRCKCLDRATARMGRGHVISEFRRDARTVFFRVSDQGFIGETEAHLQVVLGGRLQSIVSEFSARGGRGS